jgi:hypothetical protein
VAVSQQALARYFEGGSNPYGGEVKAQARRKRP